METFNELTSASKRGDLAKVTRILEQNQTLIDKKDDNGENCCDSFDLYKIYQ